MKIIYDPSKNRGLRDFGLDKVRFVPGVNELTDEQLKAVKSHPSYESLLNANALVLTEVDTSPTPEPKPKGKESVINPTEK